ncbi:restriction endonuclease subunit S [Lactiplantibacillus plantarum]|uniref:restriction endonuclease subunit S n=1 Tax=Lactiplantibacillus plantarum TaxID=1590 RepID=UPI000FFE4327|nr:restriction endonuclease subunit S [Lactiplantibacillus plantarum]RXE80325.1 restriction endonuclease subunit S [Lactiplantibacillus plantarum]RZN67974.1 restriction endonuclease subunit S [Lactiplantibacillus plantarum]
MKDNQAKYPQLRFKGFTDPWEQRKLGEVGKTQSGIGFPDAEQGGTEGVPFYKVSDMNKPGNEHEMVNANNYVNYEQLSRKKWKIIETVPAVIFAKVGAAIMLNRKRLVTSPFLIDNNTMAYVFDGSWNIDFGKTLFETINLPRYAQVGALPSYNGSDIESIEVTLPNEGEQVKLGAFFKSLDDTITLHQRKLAMLKELKQGYLQKLFPQNGSKFPQLRFAGFADAWEQRKLGDIVVFLNGRAYKQAELLDSGKYPVLRVGNFNTNDKWYYSDLELPAKNYADKGDLLYTWATAFGPHIWKGPKVIYHYHIWKVETTSDISKNFAVHLLDADQAQMTNSLNGSTMVHITKGTMENKIVTIPGISEQRNMARLLDQLDCTIALHQRKLEKLQELKKGYLQKMFC